LNATAAPGQAATVSFAKLREERLLFPQPRRLESRRRSFTEVFSTEALTT
jgi:hypothetical protein